MLLKSNENVVPLDGARSPAATGRQIGAILMDEGKLTASDAEQVLVRQRELGWRFGEAAIELNLITDAELREALAKQYEFPYLVSGPDGVSKELIAAWDPFHPTVEELRVIRTQLLMRWFNRRPGGARSPSRAPARARAGASSRPTSRWCTRSSGSGRCSSTRTSAPRASRASSTSPTASGCPRRCRGAPSSRPRCR
jgi:hypothetical protein